MVDCFMSLNVQYAIQLAKRCEDLNINWWEEVLHPDDIMDTNRLNVLILTKNGPLVSMNILAMDLDS